MAPPRLNAAQLAALDAEVDDLFDELLTRLLGHAFTGKRLFIGFLHDQTLPGLFQAGVNEEGGRIDVDMVSSIANIAEDFVNKQRADAKASTKRKIQALLHDVDQGRLKVEDFGTAVDGEMAELWSKIKANVHTVVATETQQAHTMGLKEGLDQINEGLGVEDPIVCFIPVKDKHLCKECRRVHLLPDGLTPRVFKESEVSADYHKRGEDVPSWLLLHPHCRCALSTVLPGFGFDTEGRVTWVDSDHREWDYQRGFKLRPTPGVSARRKKLGKSEVEVGEPLEKALRISMHQRDFANEAQRFGWQLEAPGKHLGMKHVVSGQRWKGFSHSDSPSLPHDQVKYYAGQMGLKIGPGPKGTARLYARKGHPYEQAYRQTPGLTEADFA